jgi:hypothetical protein
MLSAARRTLDGTVSFQEEGDMPARTPVYSPASHKPVPSRPADLTEYLRV